MRAPTPRVSWSTIARTSTSPGATALTTTVGGPRWSRRPVRPTRRSSGRCSTPQLPTPPRCGARRVTSWVFDADGSDDDVYRSSGFGADRSLHEMRVPLPLATEARLPEGITVRTFEPGRDDEAWLRVNNAAFGDHAEQGGWTVETLHAHTADAWFDPTLFLLAFDAEGLAGFNWLKWHAPIGGDTARGEIYVIGVEPRTQGTGLGRALAIEGLQLVHTRGAPVGMLFVAADNAPAIALYSSLGFTVHRTDRAYVRDLGR